ncbi:hypothetical protein ASG60_21660 [Methylobacterium sp. Leaf469]|nr:LysR substrate-binding domain-containing protein [Methylobacterium sp. Leaf469]KQT88687.1 hypothetical protein ASG60_21660 [Methylobacterium sp. Leaf469]
MDDGLRHHIWCICSIRPRLPDANGALVTVSIAARLRFDDIEVIADAARAGLGLCWLPHWLIRDSVQAGELVEIWADRPCTTVDCFAVWPATRYLPLRSRLAINVLTERLSKGDYPRKHKH